MGESYPFTFQVFFRKTFWIFSQKIFQKCLKINPQLVHLIILLMYNDEHFRKSAKIFSSFFHEFFRIKISMFFFWLFRNIVEGEARWREDLAELKGMAETNHVAALDMLRALQTGPLTRHNAQLAELHQREPKITN